MIYRIVFVCLAAWLVFISGAMAGIIWSGTQDQRAVIEISNLDINQDGIDDFNFTFSNAQLYNAFEPSAGNAAIGQEIPSMPNFYEYIPLEAGVVVEQDPDGPSHLWWDGEEVVFFSYLLADDTAAYAGSFARTNGYLGVSFVADFGATHYGWIHMSHDESRPSPNDGYLIVQSWAWESDADTPIVTGAIPEPSSGALVIVGALSLWQLRRTRQRKGINFYAPTPKNRIKPASSENPDIW